MRHSVIFRLQLLVGVMMILARPATSQTAAPQERPLLAGRHTIRLTIGMKTNTKIAATVTPGKVNLESGFVGSLGYGYWFEEEWQLGFSGGILAAQSNVEYGNVSSWSIVPVLFGINYYPTQVAMGKVGRPYIGASGGPYIGAASWVGGLSGTGSTVETVPGARFVLGVDLHVGPWFMLGPTVAYHLVGKFSEIAIEKTDFSGVEFSLTLGALL